MKNRAKIHITFGVNNWKVQKEGNKGLYCSCEKKTVAVKFAKAYAKKLKGELFIHKKNGSIQDRRNYGKDPYPLKG